jgi:hypothetical protein
MPASFDAGFLLWRYKKFQIFYELAKYVSSNQAASMTQATSIKIGAT